MASWRDVNVDFSYCYYSPVSVTIRSNFSEGKFSTIITKCYWIQYILTLYKSDIAHIYLSSVLLSVRSDIAGALASLVLLFPALLSLEEVIVVVSSTVLSTSSLSWSSSAVAVCDSLRSAAVVFVSALDSAVPTSSVIIFVKFLVFFYTIILFMSI